MEAESILAIAANILGVHALTLSAIPLEGGANNRVFKISDQKKSYLLKQYYSSQEAHWNRATTDFTFCRFAWSSGISVVPEPIGICDKDHIALYEFIEGRRLSVSEITPAIINQAANLFIELNEHRFEPKAATIPAAAEACFSWTAHFSSIEQRLQKLISMKEDQYLGQEAKNLLEKQIIRAWRSIIKTANPSNTDTLKKNERCLSPSDFGFHNALLQTDGSLRFFDFEYAGWDDPSKMICDFFCQPELPVPRSSFESFAQRTTKNFPDSEQLIQRAAKLLPVYTIKWCCILLNEFLKDDASRRRFALSTVSETERKEQQLAKTQKMLLSLEDKI